MIPRVSKFELVKCELLCSQDAVQELLTSAIALPGWTHRFETARVRDEEGRLSFQLGLTDGFTAVAMQGIFKRSIDGSCTVLAIVMSGPRIYYPWYSVLVGFLKLTNGTLVANIKESNGEFFVLKVEAGKILYLYE